MLMTIFAIIMAILMVFLPVSAIDFEASHLIVIMLVGSTSVFLAAIFMYTFILIPFATLEQTLIPNLMHLLRHNTALRIGRLILFLFPLLSYLGVALVSRIQNVNYQDWFFLIWLIFFGVVLDVFRDSWHRIVNFLNPSYLIHQFSQDATHAIQNDQNDRFLSQLDNLTEIGVRAVEKSKLALSTQTLQTLPSLIQTFLASSKSIGHASLDVENQQGAKSVDMASYTIFYLLQRLELINDRALRDRLETVCRQMTMIMGKIIIYCAQYDLSMVAFPTHFLTKFGLKAQQHHFDEVALLTTSTLIEIAKTILTEIDVTYAELQEPFRAIINGLEAIAKGSFKKQKNMSVKVLSQPFIELKGFFQTEKMANHRDTPIILQEINRVLDEFSVLEQVMQAIPPIPDLGMPEGSPPI